MDVEISNTLGRASLRHDHCGAVQVATSSNTCVSLSHRGLPSLYQGRGDANGTIHRQLMARRQATSSR